MSHPSWRLIREKPLPHVNDIDWESANDISGAGAAGANFGVPLLDNGASVHGFMVLLQAVNAGGGLITPAGTVSYVISEVVGGNPTMLISTGLSGSLTVGTAAVIDLSSLGVGSFVLRLHTASGTAGAGTLQAYAKNITG